MLSLFSCVQCCATLWTAAEDQAPLSMGFSRQEYWSGLPFPSPPCHSAIAAAAAAKSLQSCLTLRDPIDGSPPGSPIPRIPRQEHWSGLPFPSPMHESEKWKWSRVQLLVTPWTAAYQAPPSVGFSRQKSSGVGCHCLLHDITLVYVKYCKTWFYGHPLQ